MSQQQLDYATVPEQSCRPLWQRAMIAVSIIAISVAITPVAVKAAWISAGAGEGSYFWFIVLFPVPLWSAQLFHHNLSGFIETLMYLEFPAYALVLAACSFLSRRWLVTAAVVIFGLHGVGVACEYIF